MCLELFKNDSPDLYRLFKGVHRLPFWKPRCAFNFRLFCNNQISEVAKLFHLRWRVSVAAVHVDLVHLGDNIAPQRQSQWQRQRPWRWCCSTGCPPAQTGSSPCQFSSAPSWWRSSQCRLPSTRSSKAEQEYLFTKSLYIYIYISKVICNKLRCLKTYIISIRRKIVLPNDALQGFIQNIFYLPVQVNPSNINYADANLSQKVLHTCCRRSG